MLAAKDLRRSDPRGISRPRLAPPEPAHGHLAEYEAAARKHKIELMGHQRIAARYITATKPRPAGRPSKSWVESWLYREIAVVASRQNGKTEIVIPRIRMGLERGESIIHTAQNMRLPRKTFLRVASSIAADPEMDCTIRKANGQEEITTSEGGRYFVVAPNDSARGESADLVIIDEVREQRDEGLMDAILPTVTARPNAQIIYLSNAGDNESVILNELRRRFVEDHDPNLAYLEWSAAPERSIDDRDGWAEANPALGVTVSMATLEHFRATRPTESFETEHLCRWVESMEPPLVTSEVWASLKGGNDASIRPTLCFSLDPSWRRASAAIAWRRPDGKTGCELVADVTGNPIDLDAFGPVLVERAKALRVASVIHDVYSEPLAKFFPRARAMNGTEFAISCGTFLQAVEGGRLRHQNGDAIGADLVWTTKKPVGPGAWMAVKRNEDHPITAALAAIRAVGTVAGPATSGVARTF